MTSRRKASVVGVREAKTYFSALLKRVENGEEIAITRHDSPVARLVPVKKSVTPEERIAAIRQWQESSKRVTLGGLKVRDLVNEGRR